MHGAFIRAWMILLVLAIRVYGLRHAKGPGCETTIRRDGRRILSNDTGPGTTGAISIDAPVFRHRELVADGPEIKSDGEAHDERAQHKVAAVDVDVVSAVRRGDLERVERLLAQGRSPNAESPLGTPAMWSAALRGSVRILRALTNAGGDVDKPNRNGTTPLFIASHSGHLNAVKLLLNSGAEVNKRSILGFTPLMAAVYENHIRVVKELLKNGASPDIRTKRTGQTALWHAAFLGHLEVLVILLEQGADVEIPDSATGAAPLHAAAHQGREDILQHLIDAGSPVDIRLLNGATALHIASAALHLGSVEVLLSNGADPVALNGNGRSPADVVGTAVSSKDEVVVARVLKILTQGSTNQSDGTESAKEPDMDRPVPPAANRAENNLVPRSLNGQQDPDRRIEKTDGGVSTTAVIVPVVLIVAIIGFAAIITILRRKRRSWSVYGDSGPGLDPNITLNELLRSGRSRALMKGLLKPDASEGSQSGASFSLNAGPGDQNTLTNSSSIFRPTQRSPVVQCTLSEGSQWRRELPLSPSSSSSLQDDGRRAWDTFMLNTRMNTTEDAWGRCASVGGDRTGRLRGQCNEHLTAWTPETSDFTGRMRHLRQ